MNGTGTQTDPYIVMNYTDLCNMTGGSETYYKLGADINFSDTDRNADSSAISVSFKELDGDNHSLKNYFRREENSNSVSAMFVNTGENLLVFKNLKILGAYFTGGAVTLIHQTHELINQFTDCQIHIKFLNTQSSVASPYPLIGKAKIEDSEILAEGESNFAKPIVDYQDGNGFYGCLVKLDIKVYANSSDYLVRIFGSKVSFSGFVGQISCPKITNLNIDLTAYCMCSYFALAIDTFNSVEISGFEGVNFYDKTVMASLVNRLPASAKFVGLTTEQCKDGDYLNSIGFPCNTGDVI